MTSLAGKIADRFEERTNAALARAGEIHSRDPFKRGMRAERTPQPPSQLTMECLRAKGLTGVSNATSSGSIMTSTPEPEPIPDEPKGLGGGVFGSGTLTQIPESTSIPSGRSGSQNPYPGGVRAPALQPVSNLSFDMPKSAEGSQARNIGTSANVVVEPEVFNHTLRRMDSIDDFVGGEVYNMLGEIEEICSTIFQVPATVERIKNVCNEVKRCLGPFRGVTDAVAIDTRQYVHAISDIDHGNPNLTAISHIGETNAVQRANTTVNRQVNNMERTVMSYRNTANRLEHEAERERQRAANLQRQANTLMANSPN